MALARALDVQPRVLLLDEPFGALDATVRKELRDWLRKLHDDVCVTTIFVTHDQEEALEVAPRARSRSPTSSARSTGRSQASGRPPDALHYEGSAEPMREVWIAVRASLRRVLDEVTLADVAAKALPAHVTALTEDPGAWAKR